jgi:hypothetical protein
MLVPVAEKILPELMPGVPASAVMVWFGVILAMNLQTSFLTPPFGFALFYLRSVAAKTDYKDRITGAHIPAVTTAQIYKGSIAFIVLQLIMVATVIAFPGLVTGGIEKGETINADEALRTLGLPDPDEPAAATMDPSASAPEGAASEPGEQGANEEPAAEEDPMKALEDAMKKDAQKK